MTVEPSERQVGVRPFTLTLVGVTLGLAFLFVALLFASEESIGFAFAVAADLMFVSGVVALGAKRWLSLGAWPSQTRLGRCAL